MSERIYIPPRRRRQLPVSPYDLERKAAIIIAALMIAAVAIFAWVIASHRPL